MAIQKKFVIHKEKAVSPFLSANIKNVGEAAGILTNAGFRLYIYLCGNADGFVWTLNTTAYKKWLNNGMEDNSVRKAIKDGLANLIENGYVITGENKDEYQFFEARRKEKHNGLSSSGT